MPDHSLETLLSLDGQTYYLDNGYWAKFSAHEIGATDQRPHGVSYCLSLHDRNGTRILGFDNAHGIKAKKARFAAKKVTWDHQHKHNEISDYEFYTAAQLIQDFWDDAIKMMK